MPKPTVKQLQARIAELEAEKGVGSDQPMNFKVRGLLKDIIRKPHDAKLLAEQALRHLG